MAGFGLLLLGAYFLDLAIFYHEIRQVMVARFLLGAFGVALVMPGWKLVSTKPTAEEH